MSIEVVEGPKGLYVIEGLYYGGYEVKRVGPTIAYCERKYEARRDIRSGAIEATEDDG